MRLPAIEKSNAAKVVEALLQDGYQVYAPVDSDGAVKLDKITRENIELLKLKYVRTVNSITSVLIGWGEPVVSYRIEGSSIKYFLNVREEKIALFGIHPCDANAISYLDNVFLSKPTDPTYAIKRANMLTVVFECEVWDEYCFCTSVGGNKIDPRVVDIVVKPVDDLYVFRPLTPKGSAFVEKHRDVFDREVEIEWSEFRPNLSKKLSKRFLDELVSCYSSGRFEDFLNKIMSADASNYVKNCMFCQSCTVVCPTCYCLEIRDVEDPSDPTVHHRIKRRASCLGNYYSYLAGNRVLLTGKEKRFKWRILHKFPFSYNMYRRWGCVGCGRCIELCPAHIDFVKFINDVFGGGE